MNLYIKVQNGKAVDHPITEDNFKQAYPEIDIENLPQEFSKFTRVDIPVAGPYEEYSSTEYVSDGFGGFRDFHIFRQFTEAEITEKQNTTKTEWAKFGYSSWIFDDATCSFNPPTPMPNDGNLYEWDDGTLTWKIL